MKIGLILHPFGEKESAGLGYSIASLAEEIVEQDKENEYILFLKGFGSENPKFKGDNWKVERLADGFLWLDRGLRHNKYCDVYMFFTPVMPLFVRFKKTLVVVHDLGYRYIPAKNLKQWIANKCITAVHTLSLYRATKIVAISYSTRDEIIKFYPRLKDEVQVIYNGFRKVSDSIEKIEGVFSPFFLFVGVIKPRKNVLSVVQAFFDFKEKTKLPHKLVIAGTNKGSYSEKINKAISESAFGEDVICTGYVNDNELSYLYRNTEAFMFPSLLEGFGMPIMEAMSCRTPVITTNYGATKEIAGDAGLLVNPVDISDISGAMEKIAVDLEFQDALREKGVERTRAFSWQKAGAQYKKCLKEIHESA